MFRNLIARLDALFYETTVTTTVVVRRQYPKSAQTQVLQSLYAQGLRTVNENGTTYPLRADGTYGEAPVDQNKYFRKTVSVQLRDNHAAIDGRKVFFPKVICRRAPLVVNGAVNISEFPQYADADITTFAQVADRSYASYRGEMVTNSRSVARWNRRRVRNLHANIASSITDDDTISIARLAAGATTVELAASDTWTHLRVTGGEDTVSVNLTKTIRTMTDTDVVIAAFAFSRAVLLSQVQVGVTITAQDELDMAANVLTLIMTIRNE